MYHRENTISNTGRKPNKSAKVFTPPPTHTHTHTHTHTQRQTRTLSVEHCKPGALLMYHYVAE